MKTKLALTAVARGHRRVLARRFRASFVADPRRSERPTQRPPTRLPSGDASTGRNAEQGLGHHARCAQVHHQDRDQGRRRADRRRRCHEQEGKRRSFDLVDHDQEARKAETSTAIKAGDTTPKGDASDQGRRQAEAVIVSGPPLGGSRRRCSQRRPEKGDSPESPFSGRGRSGLRPDAPGGCRAPRPPRFPPCRAGTDRLP